jgi:hypothetical protein
MDTRDDVVVPPLDGLLPLHEGRCVGVSDGIARLMGDGGHFIIRGEVGMLELGQRDKGFGE